MMYTLGICGALRSAYLLGVDEPWGRGTCTEIVGIHVRWHAMVDYDVLLLRYGRHTTGIVSSP